jgi:ribonuclease E
MSIQLLINASDPEEIRVATVKDGRLEEFRVENAAREITQGNIYKGVVTRIEPSLQAAFIDYGGDRNGFLQKHDIHYDYYQEDDDGNLPLQRLIKRGQGIMVQVGKDPIGTKGAMLTTFISLPGRYVVLMPGHSVRGVSRKIDDETERARLKEIVAELELPEGFGVIVRTAGMGCTKTMISKDLKDLLRLWKTIKGKVAREKKTALLYKERALVLRSIRDSFSPDVSEILIDEPTVFQEAQELVTIFASKHTQEVKLYQGETPLFSQFKIEDQIASIFENRVRLKSGGSIVIAPTEALVAIDVNSGKSTHEKSVEQTAFQTNLEAAEEITRQLRLRDLGGLIVIDFIDMNESKHRAEVERELKNHLKLDKARTKVGRISKFGLLEMSRQRIHPTLEFGSHVTCSGCRGKGMVPSTETLGIGFLRKIGMEVLAGDVARVKGVVPPAVADYLLNRKRRELVEIETRRNIVIEIESDAALGPGESRIECSP